MIYQDIINLTNPVLFEQLKIEFKHNFYINSLNQSNKRDFFNRNQNNCLN